MIKCENDCANERQLLIDFLMWYQKPFVSKEDILPTFEGTVDRFLKARERQGVMVDSSNCPLVEIKENE